MSWYNYKSRWIDIDKCFYFNLNETDELRLTYSTDTNEDSYCYFIYDTKQERDEEFEKIKKLMGIHEHTSRCC